ncbi:MAG: PaaI family thioesterase [Pseudomonadota bacterium]
MTFESAATADEQARIANVVALLDTHFPEVKNSADLEILRLSDDAARVRLIPGPNDTRPGGTVSGPTMFTLADVSVYALLLGIRSERALQAVTTSLTINFLSRPVPGGLVADARLLKLGRRLAVADVLIRAETDGKAIAQASATYGMPPDNLPSTAAKVI